MSNAPSAHHGQNTNDEPSGLVAPAHVAFIMDGNRRYAKEHGISQKESYVLGLENMKRIALGCAQYKVQHATFFAFSTENWERDDANLKVLMSVLDRAMKDNAQIEELIDAGAVVDFVGNRKAFSQAVQDKMNEIEQRSAKNDGIKVHIAASYSGRSDIVQAAAKIAALAKEGQVQIEQIDEKMVNSFMLTYPAPDPDLLIRTGGDCRVSNFLMWQISYCELYFSDKMWPAFGMQDLTLAMSEFNLRDRRYGKL